MLTYELKKLPGMPLYEGLYRCIREDIRTGRLRPGEKLPSKRALAANLKISKITVEGAYEQLLSEGYIRSVEKIGYFVEESTKTDEFSSNAAQELVKKNLPTNIDDFSQNAAQALVKKNLPTNIDDFSANPAQELVKKNLSTNIDDFSQNAAQTIDLTANHALKFPFSVWSRLQREVMLDVGETLLAPVPNQGLYALRLAISRQLQAFRGMTVDPENILIGAGTDFLYNLLIQLLGRDRLYAVEEPGYGKIRKIYAAGGVRCISADLDSQGVCPESLGDASVLHISPSHHFPTGIVTTAQRRQALLSWAREGERYIIEDDYDSEFRFSARPIPPMQTMDRAGRVIYMNTFSKTLAASIRISYMVLPPTLMARFRETLGFYSCTVPSFEQYTLARFLDGGHFEKHINRMRKQYKSRRNKVLAAIKTEKCSILEENAGLHFLVKLETNLSGEELTARFLEKGLRARTLGSYYHGPCPPAAETTLVVNYSALTEGQADALAALFPSLVNEITGIGNGSPD